MKNIFTLLMLFVSLTLSAQPLDGTWKGKLKAGPQTLTIVYHIDTPKKTVTMDVEEQSASGIPMDVHFLTDDSINIAMPQLGITYAGRLKDGKIDGTFVQQTFSAPLVMERGEVSFNRPQEPKAPYPYTTEEVTFTNAKAPATLAGTLVYPVGYKTGKKCPVVLMVTGSGPENRDEELFHHKPFLVIADYLARHGIASLRYDDRGVEQSTGEASQATTADFAEDAKAGLTYLKGLGKFSKVGILGHSEGGAIAYMLGSEGVPDFIVSLAGPACKIDTMMVAQLNAIAKTQGATGDLVANTNQARFILLSQSNTPWMKYFLDLDMAPYVKATKCPVLALGGDKDMNVPVSINVPALKQYLPKNKRNVIKTYPGLSHLFQHSATGSPQEAVNIEETIAPEVLNDIAAWINNEKRSAE